MRCKKILWSADNDFVNANESNGTGCCTLNGKWLFYCTLCNFDSIGGLLKCGPNVDEWCSYTRLVCHVQQTANP